MTDRPSSGRHPDPARAGGVRRPGAGWVRRPGGGSETGATEAITALVRVRGELESVSTTCAQLEVRFATMARTAGLPGPSGAALSDAALEALASEDARPTSPASTFPTGKASASPRTSRRRRPRRGAVVVGLLGGAGSLLVANAVLTVAWQDPVSAVIAHGRQARLKTELSGLYAQFPTTTPRQSKTRRPTPAQQIRRLAAVERRELPAGKPIGRVRAPRLGGSWVVVQGTSTSALKSGPGHYPSSSLPGLPGTTAIAGHRTTYGAPFRHIDRLRAGDRITVEMPYGTVDYRVEGHRVVDPSNTEALRDVGRPRLVLTACTPLYSAAQRWVVYARQVRVHPRTMS